MPRSLLRSCLVLLLLLPALRGDEEFRPRRVVAPFPPIEKAPFLKAPEVRRQVLDAELIIGLVVKGQARAYPINMLTGPRREIINEELDGFRFAVTW